MSACLNQYFAKEASLKSCSKPALVPAFIILSLQEIYTLCERRMSYISTTSNSTESETETRKKTQTTA